mgnify:CR=1 FL=1
MMAPQFSALNRHQVMHGESVNYGSEINSLKALSPLNYVAVVLQEATRHGQAPRNDAAATPSSAPEPPGEST